MFNTKYGLERAVLFGRKTHTRRIANIQPPYVNSEIAFPIFDFDFDESPLWLAYCWKNKDNPKEYTEWIKPKYKEGEVVAVAQSYRSIGIAPNTIVGKDINGNPIIAIQSKGWNNKMFVKTELMTHHIQITSVIVQRLQNISDEDCLAEGIIKRWHAPSGAYHYYLPNFIVKTVDDVYLTPKEAYAALIDKIGKKGDWNANPYVWAYEFELLD